MKMRKYWKIMVEEMLTHARNKAKQNENISSKDLSYHKQGHVPGGGGGLGGLNPTGSKIFVRIVKT